MRWDPQQYARYDSERSRPFFDLVGQVAADVAGHRGRSGLRIGRADRHPGHALAVGRGSPGSTPRPT